MSYCYKKYSLSKIRFIKMSENFKLREGQPEDAPFIGETVTGALGIELCKNLANGEENISKVIKLFTDLAKTEMAQYSYKNTILAINNSGEPIGAIISYDGNTLKERRKYFISKANEVLDWNVTIEEADNWESETNPEEFYIDSLYVIPEFRNQGVATSLIKAVLEKNRYYGKPFGLLVEPDNVKAYQLYTELGFKEDGINNFFDTPMIHLIYGK